MIGDELSEAKDFETFKILSYNEIIIELKKIAEEASKKNVQKNSAIS